MIGDGVNDVIALKQANVAVGMQGGSQAARGVADLILLNDTFAPLPFAFREGQRIINGMNDILRIFMVRIFYKASIIAIVMAIGGFPFAPRQAALVSFVGAGVPAVAFAALGQPGAHAQGRPVQAAGALRPAHDALMAPIATGVYLAWALPAKSELPGRAPGRRHEGAHRSRLPAGADRAHAVRLLRRHLAAPACRAAHRVVVRRRRRSARRLAHGRVVVVLLLGWIVAVLAIPLGRTLFELTQLPAWQYFVLFAVAVRVEPALPAWCGTPALLDRWLGTAEDPGNICAKGPRRSQLSCGRAAVAGPGPPAPIRPSARPGGRADAGQRALAAGGPAGVADAAAVPHEVHVHGVDLGRVLRPGQLGEQRVRLLGGHLLADDAEPAGDAVHVRVDRHHRPPQREEQHAGGRLGADPRQAGEVGLRLGVARARRARRGRARRCAR